MKCRWTHLCERPLQQTIVILGVWISLNVLVFSKRDGKISVKSEEDKIHQQQPSGLQSQLGKASQSPPNKKEDVLGQLAADLPNLPLINLLENKGPDSVLIKLFGSVSCISNNIDTPHIKYEYQ